jgi:ketosteroid isomerase-like protein
VDDLLRTLSDWAAIADVMALYCERVDEYDIDAVAALFTEDCVTDYGPGRGGVVAGRAAVRARIAAGQAQFRRTHHQLGQSRIEFDPDVPGRASGVSYVTATHEEWDGTFWRAHLRYLDELRQTGQGWRLSARRVHAAAIEGKPSITWNWVPRQLPTDPAMPAPDPDPDPDPRA